MTPARSFSPALRALLSLLLVSLLPAPAALGGQVPLEESRERRAALAAEVGDGVILALGSPAPPQDYLSFHQNSRFRYLTGFREPDAALLLVVEGGAAHETLFVNPRDPATETWEGYRLGPEGVTRELGIPGREVGELGAVLDSVLAGRDVLHVVGEYRPDGAVLSRDTQLVLRLLDDHPDVRVNPLNGAVDRLRQRKSPVELERIRRAVTITSEAHREILGAAAPGMNEFEIQALIEYTFRRYGAERPAFASIVGSGPNATILHYNANDRFMEDGDLLLVDIGAAWGGYAADVTRTFPVNGRFTPEQRRIYRIVRSAQAAAEEVAGPGVRRDRLAEAAVRVLAQGLAELGLIEAPDATFDCEQGGRRARCPQFVLYYMHGLGHGIGLDVHDPWPAALEPGTAFTIEPGIYVRPNLFEEVIPDTPGNRRMMEAIRPAFERYRGIGVRIEDDYVVTGEGIEWLSRTPREIEEIEAAMARQWTGPGERRSEWVEWFRRMR